MSDSEFERELEKAEGGSAVAQVSLGARLLYGLGIPVDYALAHRLLLMAHNQGARAATTSLASMYQNGWGVPSDPDRAISLYEDAVSRGCWLSLVELARIYRLGLGHLSADVGQATEYYRRAYHDANEDNDWLDSEEWEEARDYLVAQGVLPPP